ncbi:MAG: T9SS type A sorting domain-containing protein [Bacteroidales bacterium]|nr:T9SS type A sorting domain-containing protein [Bacteroidales bacterium]
MNKKSILTTLGIALSAFVFGQHFPFPMNEANYVYPYGITASQPNNAKIQSKFVSWDKTMYRESADGRYGRIRFDDDKFTVSEGIGYGMLIYVYMTSETNDLCQERFDKLYAYYKRWSNGNGVMNWKIEGFESVNSYNGATDADLDVALALCLAAKQWGSSDNYVYAEEAEKLLDAIYKKEVGSHYIKGEERILINPGDSWTSVANPCYFTLASIGVFAQAQTQLEFSTTHDWKTVYDDSHIYLTLAQRNGLWPNWSNWDGTPCDRSPYDTTSMDYGWDACRTPWRVAWDYLWYGSESSKSMMQNTIDMMAAHDLLSDTKNAGYYSNLDSDDYTDLVYEGMGNISAFVGGYACALMTNADRQENLNFYHEKLINYTESPYYSPTLQMLYALVTSGNAANFYDLDGGAALVVVDPVISSVSTDGTSIVVNCTKEMSGATEDFSGFSLFVDGVERTDAISSISVSGTTIELGFNELDITPTSLLALSYSGASIESAKGGKLSKVIKLPIANKMYVVGGQTIFADCEHSDSTLLGGRWYSYSDGGKGSSQSYKMLPEGANSTETGVQFTYEKIQSYAGVGFNILDGENPLDCSGSTGISFYHKGDACNLEAKTITKKNANYSYQTYRITAHEDWTLITLKWEDIASDFVSSGYVTEVTGFQWSRIGSSGSFGIDEVTLLGREFSASEVNRSVLENTLAQANAIYSKATEEKYLQTAIDAFADAIDVAADVDLNPSASRAEIDTANAHLTTAIAELQLAAYGNKAPFGRLIKTATVKSENAVVGTEKGNYPQEAKDALNAAIAAANEIFAAEKLLQLEIDDAMNTLQQAITDFEYSVETGLDYAAIDEYIALATEILATTEAGTEIGQYSAYRRERLERALKTANTVRRSISVSQSTVDMNANSLLSMYINYKESQVLETAIEQVDCELVVYPNPCFDYVRITANDGVVSVAICSLQGQSVYQGLVYNDEVEINLSSLKSGVYIATITLQNGEIRQERLVISK